MTDLRDPDIKLNPKMACATALALSHQNPACLSVLSRPFFHPHRILSAEKCKRLRDYCRDVCVRRGEENVDIVIEPGDLIALIGKASVHALAFFFRFQGWINLGPNCIVLRRRKAGAAGGDDAFVPFHHDQAIQAMNVALNDDEDYVRGRMVYVTVEGIVTPERKEGTVVMHNNKVVHGVQRLQSGARYDLILTHHHVPRLPDVVTQTLRLLLEFKAFKALLHGNLKVDYLLQLFRPGLLSLRIPAHNLPPSPSPPPPTS